MTPYVSRSVHFTNDSRLDIIGATTSSEAPHLTRQQVAAALDRFTTPTGREWGFDVFDCPIDLFECLVDVTFLKKQQDASGTLPEEAFMRCIELGHAAKTWQPIAPPSYQKRQTTEIWRHGILLHLIQLLQLPEEVFGTQNSLHEIFRRLDLLSPETNRMFSISWPLFQAALCLGNEDEQRKQWLRDDFKSKFQARGCCNAKMAIEVLDRVWQTGDVRLVKSAPLLF